MKIIINPKYEYLSNFIQQIPSKFSKLGHVIYDGRNIIRVAKAPDGTILNIKQYHPPRFINALVYSSYLRKPKGIRAYTYAIHLLDSQVETPEPVAYIEERIFGIIQHSYFVSIQSDYPHLMYELGDAKPELYIPMAKAFARYTALLHSKQIMHLDYSPGNILWKQVDDKYQFSLVDINRMYFGHVSMEKGCKNFARLWGPKAFLILIAEEYAKECHYDVSKCIDLVLHYRSNFWHKFSRKHKVKFNLEY